MLRKTSFFIFYLPIFKFAVLETINCFILNLPSTSVHKLRLKSQTHTNTETSSFSVYQPVYKAKRSQLCHCNNLSSIIDICTLTTSRQLTHQLMTLVCAAAPSLTGILQVKLISKVNSTNLLQRLTKEREQMSHWLHLVTVIRLLWECDLRLWLINNQWSSEARAHANI